MSTHTPGPWEAMNGTDVFTPLRARNAAGVAASHSDGWYVADCAMGETETDDGYTRMSRAERLANARLIAAAPDLLSSNERLLNNFKAAIAGRPVRDADETIAQAQTAIAKATGAQL